MRIVIESPPSRIVWMYAWTASRTSWERFPWDVFCFKNASINSRFSFSSRRVIRSFSSIPDPSPRTQDEYDMVIHRSGISWRFCGCILGDGTYTFCQLSYDVRHGLHCVGNRSAERAVLSILSAE